MVVIFRLSFHFCYNRRGELRSPAITVIGTADPFYDETIDYFNRLNASRVRADLEILEGGYHAFDMTAPYAKINKNAYSFLLEKFNEYTENYL